MLLGGSTLLDPADCELGVEASKRLNAANIRLLVISGMPGAGTGIDGTVCTEGTGSVVAILASGVAML